jgi:hypothetical protein
VRVVVRVAAREAVRVERRVRVEGRGRGGGKGQRAEAEAEMASGMVRR